MVIQVIGVVVTSVFALVVLLVANGIYFFNKFKMYVADIASKSFLDVARNIYDILPNNDKIFLLIQLLALTGSTIGFIIYSLKQKNKSVSTQVPISKSTRKKESQTDLDMLLEMLISKKSISVGDIEKLFKINNEVAMDWCKILENAKLAIIDYPTFKKPILRLPEDENKTSDTGNEKVEKNANPVSDKKKSKIVDKNDKLPQTQKESNDKTSTKIVSNKASKIKEEKKEEKNEEKEKNFNIPKNLAKKKTSIKKKPIVKEKTSIKKTDSKKKSPIKKKTKLKSSKK